MIMECCCQNYKWGKMGLSSLVGQIMMSNSVDGTGIDKSLPYAEYWMGTHPNAPSSVMDFSNKKMLLSEYLEKRYAHKDLPFLFKVLSIAKPLSIQVHPSKDKAEEFHLKFPYRYKDSRNKPEMAIVLSDNFKMLFGIKTLSFFKKPDCGDHSVLPTLHQEIIDYYNTKTSSSLLLADLQEEDYKKLMTFFLSLDHDHVKSVIDKLLVIANKNSDVNTSDQVINLLYNEFGYDKGVVFSIFMNILHLRKNDCIFITDNIPHSYIEGDIMECMVNSDFVIRLGLTPKETDIPSFCDIFNNKFKDLLDFNKENINFAITDDDKTISSVTKKNKEAVYTRFQYHDFKEFLVYLITERTKKDSEKNIFDFFSEEVSVMFIYDCEGEVSCTYTTDTEKHSFLIKKFSTFFLEKGSLCSFVCSGRVSIFIATYQK